MCRITGGVPTYSYFSGGRTAGVSVRIRTTRTIRRTAGVPVNNGEACGKMTTGGQVNIRIARAENVAGISAYVGGGA